MYMLISKKTVNSKKEEREKTYLNIGYYYYC